MPHPHLVQNILRTAMALLGGLSLQTFAQADVVNGDFSGGLSGWQTFGDAATLSASPAGWSLPVAGNTLVLGTATSFGDDYPLADGHYLLSSRDAGAVGVPGGLEDFVGVPLGSLDPDPVNHTSFLWEGSAARQSLSVRAGDTLRFNWNLVSADRDFNDLALLVIDTASAGGPQVLTLGGAASANLAVQGNSGLQQTGTQSFSHVFTQTGTVTLSWAVADAQAGDQTTFLTLNQVQVTSAVPEPTALWLVLAGLGVVACRQGGRLAGRRLPGHQSPMQLA